jgi:diacylglycerol kinase family enzyme
VSAPPGFVVLANRAAGSVDDRSLGAVAATLAEHAPVRVQRTADPEDIDRALASLDGCRPVVLGGDGSLHLVVNRLLALGLGETPVGLVPLGTANDLARGLGLPRDPVAAARVVATGRPRPLPVAERVGDGEAVLNTAHVGIGVRAARVGGVAKRGLGALAYPAGALVAGVRPERFDVEVTVDDRQVHTGPVVAVLATLGPRTGGRRLLPGVDLADDCLDVLVVPPVNLPRRLGLVVDVLRGRDPADRPDLARAAGRRVTIRPLDPSAVTARWDTDGELRRWPGPVSLSVVPGAWQVVVPDAG